MINFVISLNGEKIGQSGLPVDRGVHSVIIHHISASPSQEEILDLNVSGLNSETNHYLQWISRKLFVGDEVNVKIIDSDSPDIPAIKPRETEQEVLKRKIDHFYKLREELKDYIDK